MKKIILNYSLVFLLLLSAFFSWLSVYKAINVSESSSWAVPIYLFSIFFVILGLSIILISEKLVLRLSILLSFLLSSLIVFNLGHVLFSLVAVLLVLGAERTVEKHLKNSVKLNVANALSLGRVMIVVAIALTVASQYFFEIKDFQLEKIISQLEISPRSSSESSKILTNFASGLFPEMVSQEENNRISIDQFILKNYPEPVTEIEKEEVLQEGRRSIEEITGIEISGQENVADIFPGVLNNQINKFIVSRIPQEVFPLMPAILAAGIFLAVLSLGLLLVRILVWIIHLLFWVLVKLEIVKISHVSVEMEVIE